MVHLWIAADYPWRPDLKSCLLEIFTENLAVGFGKIQAVALKEKIVSEFKDVTVVKEANVYFEGKVTSRAVIFADGSKKTLGIMLPGEYLFNTDSPEIMEILSGEVEVLLPGEREWKAVKGSESFEVPGHAQFSLNVKSLTDYCCSYG